MPLWRQWGQHVHGAPHKPAGAGPLGRRVGEKRQKRLQLERHAGPQAQKATRRFAGDRVYASACSPVPSFILTIHFFAEGLVA